MDIQISQGVFYDENAIKEVNNLRIKVQTVLKEILIDYLKEKAQ